MKSGDTRFSPMPYREIVHVDSGSVAVEITVEGGCCSLCGFSGVVLGVVAIGEGVAFAALCPECIQTVLQEHNSPAQEE